MVVSSFGLERTSINQDLCWTVNTSTNGLKGATRSQELIVEAVIQQAGQLNAGWSPRHTQKKIIGLPPPPWKTPTGPAAMPEPTGL